MTKECKDYYTVTQFKGIGIEYNQILNLSELKRFNRQQFTRNLLKKKIRTTKNIKP